MIGMVDLAEYMSRDLEGDFWVPGEEGSKFHGRLNYSDTSIKVKISECLHENSDHLSAEVRRLEVLHGNVEKLGEVTFFDSYLIPKTTTWTGEHEKWEAHSDTFLIGANINEKNAVEFNRATFSVEGLDEWANEIGGIRTEPTETDPIVIGLNYEFPPTQGFELWEEGKLLGIETKVEYNIEAREAKLAEKLLLELRKEKKEALYGSLDDVMADIHSLRDLLSVLIGRRVPIRDIGLTNYDPETGKYKDGYQYFTRNSITGLAEINQLNIFISYSNIKGRFEEILKEWFKFKERNEHILKEIFNTYLGGSIFATFFSYSKILEALQEDVCTGKPFDDGLVESINKEIESLTSRYNAEIKKRYMEEVSWINRYTLRERLEILFDEFLSEDVKTRIGADPQFVKRVKNVRNDLAHLNKGVSKLDIQELYDLSKKLKTIIHIIIFKSIGLTDELLLKRLETIQKSPIEFIFSQGN